MRALCNRLLCDESTSPFWEARADMGSCSVLALSGAGLPRPLRLPPQRRALGGRRGSGTSHRSRARRGAAEVRVWGLWLVGT